MDKEQWGALKPIIFLCIHFGWVAIRETHDIVHPLAMPLQVTVTSSEEMFIISV